jgi:hypothetical protein
MKERLCLTVAAALLLVAVTLPVLSSALSILGVSAGSRQTSHEQVARRGADSLCQSSSSCGG